MAKAGWRRAQRSSLVRCAQRHLFHDFVLVESGGDCALHQPILEDQQLVEHVALSADDLPGMKGHLWQRARVSYGCGRQERALLGAPAGSTQRACAAQQGQGQRKQANGG